MTRRKRRLFIAAVLLTAIVAVGAGITALVLRSQWFYEQVRQRVVSTVETATGGRVEARSFEFDWTRMRAEIQDFVVHGTEPAGKPPLFRAQSVAVGLKVVSVWKRSVDVQYLEVADPHVYLIVASDGSTNVPEPKIKSKNPRSAVDTILDLAIGRLDLRNGLFEIEDHGKTPFEAHGRNLNARFTYELAGPRYRGNISIQPLDLAWGGHSTVPVGVELALAIARSHIDVTSARLATGESRVEFSGAVDDLTSPHGAFTYNARVSIGDVSRILKVTELQRGTADIGGNVTWPGGSKFNAAGNLRAYGVDYRDSTITLRDCRLDAALTATPAGIDLTGARLAGNYIARNGRVAATGQIASIALRGRELDLHQVVLSGLGGTFRGEARLRDLRYYMVTGEIAGFAAQPIVSLYSPERLPWDARGAGSITVEGTLGRKEDLKVAANLDVTPAPQGAPVSGHISAAYEGLGETIDLARSTLSLPSTRVDFSGVLGRELQAHVETRDLNDIIPALGGDSDKFPFRIENGSAVFDGKVTGKIDAPLVNGHLSAKGLAWSGRRFETVDSAVTATPDSIHFQNVVVTRGSIRGELQITISPRNWKIGDDTPVAGSLSVRNAEAVEVAAFLGSPDLPVTGKASTNAQISATLGDPVVAGDAEIVKGSLQDEPFDRFTGRLRYTNTSLQLTGGNVVAGAKEVNLSASYNHPEDHFDQGKLHFQVSSNSMPLEQIPTLASLRPGVKGTIQVKGQGDLLLTPSGGTEPVVRLTALEGEAVARGLQLTGQALGDARLTANSQAGTLRLRLASDFANSNIRGEGEWRLSGDYPGSATITTSRLDFAQLESWLFPSDTGELKRIAGFAEGELRIQGPALKPAEMKAELRIPKLEIAPGPANGRAAQPPTQPLALHNDGPIVATLANNVVTIQSAHLKGRTTDLTLAGRAALDSKTPLDLRVNGKIDLAIVRDLDPNLLASGTVAADATVRGTFESPQVNGRLQFQGAELSVADFPNGIANAKGVILLSGNRATIQSLTGETGGGQVELSGFASYAGEVPVFQLHSEARQVRVRYPEGVSTVANASLTLSGTEEHSVLSGTITVLRTGFNPQSDFSSIIAKSAEPVRTPSAPTGILGGLNFDVQINTAPDIQFQSSLTQDLQVDANLQLRGNVSNPAVIGRLVITQGQLVFYGTKYTINQGSISFYNPVKIDPILDIDLETKARGIDITLTVSGPLNKPKLTPRSDPPLQFQEIVALLATGRTPTSDPTLLAQQSTSPQSWQQMGASALLGSAIANPVAGRLQRFFGVSKLRIDPTLPGVENNPQARLTLEQQVTPDITFTYITNVTTTNPQVVRVEWAVSKQWSVVALRDENGTFGLDFFFKKRL